MDKLGRRFLLTFSSSIMVLSISSLGAFFFIKINQNNVELATSLEVGDKLVNEIYFGMSMNKMYLGYSIVSVKI